MLGSLDTTFAASNGKIVALGIGPGDHSAKAVALQSNGKIVLAGYCRDNAVEDFCVARLNAGPLDKQCSLDIGGDGIVSSATDALIITRAAPGIHGIAIIAGITAFPPNRQTHHLAADSRPFGFAMWD